MWALTDMPPQTKHDYEVYMTRRGRYWRVAFDANFRTSADAIEKLLKPLEDDLIQSGRSLKIKKY